ncbi:bacterial transcriptional activator domain-containing protein [Nigerium massiliense]|uniref:bacterial transcriptional activator domain-containing protein n=1 Tax=Nigerium massiliense TaxID=1522317 RepID=UPI00059010B8|nr:bacterial transcriptional activator domain-containing protein [Nigerium massiliense]
MAAGDSGQTDQLAIAAVAGGISAAAAAAVLGGALLRRRRQAQERELGRRSTSDEEVRRFETALGLRAAIPWTALDGYEELYGNPEGRLDDFLRGTIDPAQAAAAAPPAGTDNESGEVARALGHEPARSDAEVDLAGVTPAGAPWLGETLDPAMISSAAATAGSTVAPGARRLARPDEPAERVVSEETARAVDSADRLLARTRLVDRAMRHLSADWWQRRRPAARLDEARVSPEALEFVFADEAPDAPVGFSRHGRTLRIGWDALAGLPAVVMPVAYPALVTLGLDDDGRHIMIDLLGAGVLGLRGASAETLAAIQVELTCAPWADELSVRVVTSDDRFVRAAALEDVRCLDDPEAAVLATERAAAERMAALADDAYDAVRTDPARADAWAPWVVLFEQPPTPAQIERLEAAIELRPLGLAAVAPVGDAHQHRRLWDVRSGEDPAGRLEPEGRSLRAQTLPVAVRDRIAALFEDASAPADDVAPWWKEKDDASRRSDDMMVVTLRPQRAIEAPMLRLFGDVRLEGTQGEPPSRARGRCLEYCAWLLQNPGSTALDMTRALFVSDGTRRSNLSRLRTWLGDAPDGQPYLPDAYSGRIALHPGVTSDWAEMQALVARGVNNSSDGELRSALELVTGAPFADAMPGQWAWAGELRSDMAALARDAGVMLARSALAKADAALARWACERALTAAPDDELLLCELMRAEDALGNRPAVQALARRLTDLADRLGLDLRTSTVHICQELLDERPRLRRA